MKSYHDFLTSKFKFSKSIGVKIDVADVNEKLKPHQRDIVAWACDKGRAAIFAAFGLGKTFMQCEIMRLLHKNEGGRHLVICPLGVRQEFVRDGANLGVQFNFVRKTDEVSGDGFYLTNYESVRDGKLDVTLFTSVSLDEASVLRSYGSKTYQSFLTLFSTVKYRFVATATPSPNRYKELIHYAGFLGIMDTGNALTRFFQRDSTQANNLTLYPHMRDEFFVWLHSWAIFLQKPSDLGYSDDGYDLPPLTVTTHVLKSDKVFAGVDKWGQVKLFRDNAKGLKVAAEEKRYSINARVDKMLEIINGDKDSHYIIWHDLEDERKAVKKALPESVEIYGTLDLEIREERIAEFSDGHEKYLLTKPVLSGSGCNFQRHCHKAIFLGVGYKFNDFIQSIHRIHRFMQDHPVEIHIIYLDTEVEVVNALMKKWEQHKELVEEISAIIREHGLATASLEEGLKRTIGVNRHVIESANATVVNNDCVDEVTNHLQDNSVDQIITSVPFGNHYEYTSSYEDFGHNDDNARFFDQMDYLTPQLLRVLKPGRIACIHVKDRVRFGNVTGHGVPTIDPFHSDCIVHYRKHGFLYMGMITVVTDVVRENNQTYRLGWTENCKDGTKMGVGSPEYVLLFRKLASDTSKAYADVPVVKDKNDYSRARWQVDAHAYWRSDGDRFLSFDDYAGLLPDELSKQFRESTRDMIYSYEDHIKVGEELDKTGRLPASFMAIAPGSHDGDVWDDVNRMRTLNGEQVRRDLAMHVCPLQFDIVDRLINRYSNKGDLIFDPFGGLMTVPYCAVKSGRRGYGVELSEGYFRDGAAYVQAIENKIAMPTLFDHLFDTNTHSTGEM